MKTIEQQYRQRIFISKNKFFFFFFPCFFELCFRLREDALRDFFLRGEISLGEEERSRGGVSLGEEERSRGGGSLGERERLRGGGFTFC